MSETDPRDSLQECMRELDRLRRLNLNLKTALEQVKADYAERNTRDVQFLVTPSFRGEFPHSDPELCDGYLLPRMLEMFGQSNHDLRICTPFLTEGGDFLISPPLQDAIQRGVHVRVLFRYPMTDSFSSATDKFTEIAMFQSRLAKLAPATGLDIRFHGKDLRSGVHAKIVVADVDIAGGGSVLISSANWTENSMIRNPEAGLWLRLPVVVRKVAAWFDAIFARSTTYASVAEDLGRDAKLANS